jgi:hypothetical protein
MMAIEELCVIVPIKSIYRCLADLSRLIPSQYMRKGRGRVEKTEIIEMAIRHLKNLQTQEVLREATYAEHYRSGYNDCVSEAAKFLLRERDEELYYKMITHLRDHMAEAMKGKALPNQWQCCSCPLCTARSCVGCTLWHFPLLFNNKKLLNFRSDPSNVMTQFGLLNCVSDGAPDVVELKSGLVLPFEIASAASSCPKIHKHVHQTIFIYRTHFCRTALHIRDSPRHFPSLLGGEYFKSRCNGDMMGAGSPTSSTVNSYHHPNPPLSQLREMLTTSASDAEHNSDDHHDVKDLSFRSNGGAQQQTPIVGSSTSAGSNIHHMDTSDYDSTRSPTTSSGTTSTTSTRMTTANINHHLSNLSPPHAHESTVRMRKLSENSTDVEHCNNNSYKFKNYIQQRFTHETYHSEESMQSNQCATENAEKKPASQSPISDSTTTSAERKLNGVHHDIKNELLVSNSPSPAHNPHPQQQPPAAHMNATARSNGKLPNGAINGSLNGNNQLISHHSIPIPVFACHTQGFYVPLNVDYDLLIPFLGGMDLLSKSFAHMPPLHPISINVNYSPALIKNAIASASFIKPKVENGIINGW